MAKKNWKIDKANSQIRFKVKHLMITTVNGEFSDYDAYVQTDEDDFSTAAITFVAKTASVHTGSADRDAHIKSSDFFDVEKFPEIRFVSNSMTKKSGNNYRLEGNISIRDVTKKILLNAHFTGFVQDQWGAEKAGFVITGKLNRKKFGLVWNVITDRGSLLVGEDVKLECEAQFTPEQ